MCMLLCRFDRGELVRLSQSASFPLSFMPASSSMMDVFVLIISWGNFMKHFPETVELGLRVHSLDPYVAETNAHPSMISIRSCVMLGTVLTEAIAFAPLVPAAGRLQCSYCHPLLH